MRGLNSGDPDIPAPDLPSPNLDPSTPSSRTDSGTTPNRTTRGAAIWATVVAVPVAALVCVFLLSSVSPESQAATPQTSSVGTQAFAAEPVTMAVRRLSDRATSVCRTVTAQLPVTVRDLPRRAVSAGPTQNAAYGAPAITVACGVPAPRWCTSQKSAADCVALESILMMMNRVCWYPEQRSGATVWTTTDRQVPVQVTVPAGYEQPAQWTNEFSDTVAATVAQNAQVPSGCA